MRTLLFLILFTALGRGAGNAADTVISTRVEVAPTAAGADLITFYRNGIPQIAILRDTLDDPRTGAHRLRQVWTLTYARPNWRQRMAAAMPFFYHRAGRNSGSKRSVPDPIFDLSHPTRGTLGRVGEEIVQLNVFDSYGALVRAPTRSYRGNALDYRNMYMARSLELIERAASTPTLPAAVAAEDWEKVRGRLFLGQRLLGGLVSDERAASAAAQEHTREAEDRAANWDLLRQSAEANALYLEPLGSEEGAPREALLWFAQSSPLTPPHFESGFLNISDPWRDDRLKTWDGYTRTWYLDDEGTVVERSSPNAKAKRMIPLAVYALDYPRVPVMLVDFRGEGPRRREMLRRAADEAATGVFGLTPYASIPWFAARASFLWVRNRHGAAHNRSLRLAAYARLRQYLLDSRGPADSSFNDLLETKLDAIALNPFEQGAQGEALLAQRQYAALMRWAADPNGLARALNRERAREYYHRHERGWSKVLQVASLGVWKPWGRATPDTIAGLDRDRRLEEAARILRDADQQPHLLVVWGSDRIRNAVSDVSALAEPGSEDAAVADRVRNKTLPPPAASPVSIAAGAGQ